MQHIQSAIQQVNNGLSASGTAYVGSTGVAYLFWHLSRHVAHGSLQIPRHLILLPAPTDPAKMQSTRLATPVELTQVRRCAAPPRAGDRGDCAPRRVAAGLLAGLLFLFLDMSSFLLHVALALCNAAIEAYSLAGLAFLIVLYQRMVFSCCRWRWRSATQQSRRQRGTPSPAAPFLKALQAPSA